MTPAMPMRSVPMDVAGLAMEHVQLRGDFELLQSEVRQAIVTLTTAVHNMEAEQMRAREERERQTAMLHTLMEKASGVAALDARNRESAGSIVSLQLQVSHWRGVVVGFMVAGGFALTVASTYVVYRLDALDARVQGVEVQAQARRDLP